MATAPNNYADYVKLIPQLPILGGLLAISYDVGYFWGADITYYSLFSLTEHLVFATQALPLAVIATVSYILITAVIERYRSAITPHTASAEDRKSKRRFPIGRTIAIWIVQAFIALMAIFFLLNGKYDLATAYGLLFALFMSIILTPKERLLRYSPIVFMITLVLGAFSFGAAIAIRKLQNRNVENILNMNDG
jgi:hypothetical protein